MWQPLYVRATGAVNALEVMLRKVIDESFWLVYSPSLKPGQIPRSRNCICHFD